MRTRMYERDAALTAVRRLLDAAYTGHGGMVFVVAAAGLGKTSVLDAAVGEAWTRFDVRIGRADAVEATLPYGLIGQALGEDAEPADGERAGDLPVASRYYATLRRIRRQAADRPLLLALDDLHWSDPDSLALVHLLCRRAPELPVAVVATGSCPRARSQAETGVIRLEDEQTFGGLASQPSVLKCRIGCSGDLDLPSASWSRSIVQHGFLLHFAAAVKGYFGRCRSLVYKGNLARPVARTSWVMRWPPNMPGRAWSCSATVGPSRSRSRTARFWN